MKRIIILLFLVVSVKGNTQFRRSIFSKDPILNNENFQKSRVYFGYYLGFSSFDFKIDYKDVTPDVLTAKSTGFNVGVVGDLRLHEYVSLRFEPGLYATKRDLTFPGFTTSKDAQRKVNSTYIHLPLLLKFSSVRVGNIRPYLLGGVATTLNLSSDAKIKDDNAQQRFRVKPWTQSYDVGAGIDIFLEYFIFSPSIRGSFGINDELVRDNDPNSPWTGNVKSLKSRAFIINFTFH